MMSQVTLDDIVTALIAIAVICIIGGFLWFISTLGSIPGWAWLVLVGLAIFGFFYKIWLY